MKNSSKNIKPIAIYLPQFHPIPENDKWWSKGFTEWTNVTKAQPLYNGHYQPHLPADLGFYDLRLSEVREAQAKMAKENGVYGFCYYHYWFNGKRILERPFQEVFESKKPDFPFMLCWANENWTRTWDGLNNNVLLEQQYSEDDDRAHIKFLIPYFKDKRYIKVNNKPVFAIYKSTLLPNINKTINIWREEAKLAQLDLYLCVFEGFGNEGKQMVDVGFNASIEFQPFSKYLAEFIEYKTLHKLNSKLWFKFLKNIYRLLDLPKKTTLLYENCKKSVRMELEYSDFVDYLVSHYQFEQGYTKFPGITPSWDNTARRGKEAFYLKNSTPQKFEEWIRFLKDNMISKSDEENFIFINAWNEWGEGNHMEPCQKWGQKYLESLKNVIA
ncbi:MAG: glycoside hydrolase family 99-like domain-containing protein [Bacteroidetes bacterium]|nr:glycoside hydrolase family 99-like domain-containing protein [Bacteroidota bacterium]